MFASRSLRRLRDSGAMRHGWAALLELALVFIGVLAALAASDYQERLRRAASQREALEAVRADMIAYVRAGLVGDDAFLPYFRQSHALLLAGLERQSLDGLPGLYFGDHFKLELTHNLHDTGRFEELDLDNYRRLARFLVIHRNFLHELERFNAYQIDHVYPQLDDPAAFFDVHGALKPRYALLPLMSGNRPGFAGVTVELARKLVRDIEELLQLPPATLPEAPSETAG